MTGISNDNQVFLHLLRFYRSSKKKIPLLDLITIDNLFHMADDINRAVGDLVSVMTEPPPPSNGSSMHYQPIENTVAT